MQRLQTFCSEDLGGLYLDILKDRLYTTAATGQARRSAQSALWHITQSLLRLMAPVLTFTAEEAWGMFTGKPDDSVLLHTWYVLPQPADEAALLEKWRTVREVRAWVQKELEEVRASGAIGSSLQAEVEIALHGSRHDALATLGEDLRFVLITSQAGLAQGRCRRSGVRPGRREPPREVLALLALACRRGSRRGASGAVRALHGQPLRRG